MKRKVGTKMTENEVKVKNNKAVQVGDTVKFKTIGFSSPSVEVVGQIINMQSGLGSGNTLLTVRDGEKLRLTNNKACEKIDNIK